jgi:hypothetical protein
MKQAVRSGVVRPGTADSRQWKWGELSPGKTDRHTGEAMPVQASQVRDGCHESKPGQARQADEAIPGQEKHAGKGRQCQIRKVMRASWRGKESNTKKAGKTVKKENQAGRRQRWLAGHGHNGVLYAYRATLTWRDGTGMSLTYRQQHRGN